MSVTTTINQNTKILVIDDCEDNLLLMKLVLEMEGYQASLASNGKKGLEEIDKSRPDLIILDYMMPDMTGLEVLEQLKKSSLLFNIPTLILTANTNLRIEEIADVDEVCYKPFDLDRIIDKIKSMLTSRQGNEMSRSVRVAR